MDGMEWVELFVREMMSASNIDDARARASRALEALEKSICTRAGAEAAKSFHQVFYCLYQCFLSIFSFYIPCLCSATSIDEIFLLGLF